MIHLWNLDLDLVLNPSQMIANIQIFLILNSNLVLVKGILYTFKIIRQIVRKNL